VIAFDETTHTYRVDGVRFPSVTEVLAPQTDWSHVPAWQLEAARCLGRDVHAAVNLLARGQLDESSLDPAVAPYVNGAAMFLRTSGATVLAAEQRVACKRMRVAGTLDLLIYWGDFYYFVDWKVSDAVPKTVGAQLAAYEYLYSETFPLAIKHSRTKRLCVRLKHNDYSSHRCNEYNSDLNLFRACTATWWHREERKYG
jgi:hypothetical protein